MKPKTGLVTDHFDSRKPTAAERELADWAASRGLFLHVSRRNDGEGGSYDTCDLGLEEVHEGIMFAYFLAMPTQRRIWPEALAHYEKLLRAGIEREKEELRFKWWEHV